MHELNELRLESYIVGRLTDLTATTYSDDETHPETKPVWIEPYTKGRLSPEESEELHLKIEYIDPGRRPRERMNKIFRPGALFRSVVPDTAQQDDLLVTAFGCPLPLMLRPTSDNYFHFIGPVFSSGLSCTLVLPYLRALKARESGKFIVI
jgi:hypothetical protein